MYRFLLIALAIWVVWRILRPGRGRATARPALTETVRCAGCGVHLPRETALEAHGQFYCSAGHRDAA